MLNSGTIDIISSNFRNVVRIPELLFLLLHQFFYKEDIYLISSKTSNILKTNACSKEHSYLFPNNLKTIKFNKNSNIQLKKYDYSLFGNTFQEKLLLYRNLSIYLQSAINDWFLCLSY